MADSTDKPNLMQRLKAVAAEVGKVVATGKNQFNASAISIYDVENAIRDHLAEQGIITRWSFNHELLEGGKLWKVYAKVIFVNVDDPTEEFWDEVQDIGSNPAAASSFARKQYYRALFHLATADDDKIDNRQQQPQQRQTPSASPAPQRAAAPAQPKAEAPSMAADQLTEIVRALREEGKVTARMVALLKELGIGAGKRVSDLDVGAQVYLVRQLLQARAETEGGDDEKLQGWYGELEKITGAPA